jgi:catechol 2,3-dioxygenase-like lactoylglutathione lyase family enzyme
MAITSAVQHVVIDTHDPQLVAGFWAEALGREIVDDWGGFVRLAPDRAGTQLAFAAVPEAKTVKNRVHLDLTAVDRQRASEELIAIGATMIETRSQDGHRWSVMADPEGNEFCLATGQL